MQIKLNKHFLKDLQEVIDNYPAISRKISNLRDDIHIYWFSYQLFQKYDIKSLWDNFFRIKFIPIRIIVYISDDIVYFDQVFKRKWSSDYKFDR